MRQGHKHRHRWCGGAWCRGAGHEHLKTHAAINIHIYIYTSSHEAISPWGGRQGWGGGGHHVHARSPPPPHPCIHQWSASACSPVARPGPAPSKQGPKGRQTCAAARNSASRPPPQCASLPAAYPCAQPRGPHDCPPEREHARGHQVVVERVAAKQALAGQPCQGTTRGSMARHVIECEGRRSTLSGQLR